MLANLHFPNGVQILPGSSSEAGKPKAVLVAELGRRRILQCTPSRGGGSLKVEASRADNSPESSSAQRLWNCSIWVDNLPGLPDNIRLKSGQNGSTSFEIIVGCATKIAAPFSLPHLMWAMPRLSKAIFASSVAFPKVHKQLETRILRLVVRRHRPPPLPPGACRMHGRPPCTTPPRHDPHCTTLPRTRRTGSLVRRGLLRATCSC